MYNNTARALALALVAGVAGLGMVPTAAAADPDCVNDDFSIPASEPGTPRTLAAAAFEIGRADVTSSGGNKDLNVKLKTDGDVLEWDIFHVVDTECVRYTDGGCDTPSQLDELNQQESCTLIAPGSGTKSFWVRYENMELPIVGDPLDYTTWAA